MAHDVVLRGLGGGVPLLLERTDQKFIDATLAACSTLDPLPALESSRPGTDDAVGAIKLYQPVHRSFTLAMLEAACDQFGEPRLDPAKIDSSGFVVRRVARANTKKRSKNDGEPSTVRVLEAWVQSEGQMRGWLPFTDADDADLDPDPARRPQPFHAGQPEMKKLLAALTPQAAPLSEDVTALFVAPTEVCEASRRSILYGVVPVTSSETSEASPALSAIASDDATQDLVDRILPVYFQQNDGLRLSSTIGGVTFSRLDVQKDDSALQLYLQFLRTLQVQLDLLGDSPESEALRTAIDGNLRVFFSDDDRDPGSSALQHLTDAINALVLGGDASVTLPLTWDAVSAAQASTLHDSVTSALGARARAVLPAEGRFDDQKALYHVRAFIRVLRDDGCPPELVWSDPSPDFEIVPWFESGKLPPTVIQLPEVSLANLKKFKPNVAFKVPGTLFNFLNKNKAKDLIDGKGSQGDDDGIDWICGFNIPIITICAFIILYLFLTLLDIVFWWMAFIKICIPIPRKL
ncbi:MAG TPA: hypothetical protein VFF06_01970 [Polyangia bacterium]|nr:hypothetical protein [Polyangia bacterium]